jgi:hypothetical protein
MESLLSCKACQTALSFLISYLANGVKEVNLREDNILKPINVKNIQINNISNTLTYFNQEITTFSYSLSI